MSSTDNKTIIAAIAIDGGAAHTGVFRALYEQGTAIDNIGKRYGEVLTLDSANYTLLMRDRTAKRHMRRGFDRRKLAKRLLTLVLKHYFEFPVEAHCQALGFLLNRRGFTRLEESFDAEALATFPEEAWNALPAYAKDILESLDQIKARLEQLIANEPERIEKLHSHLLEQTIQPVKKSRFVLGYVEKLQTAIETRRKGEPIKETKKEQKRLSQTPSWVIDVLVKHGIIGLKNHQSEDRSVDLLDVLNQTAQLDELREQLKPVQQTLRNETDTVWAKLNPESFDLEKNTAKLTDENKSTFVEAHLNNLVFAIHKANDELASGSRHRRKYFEEIKENIENAHNNPHRYMQRFAKAIDVSPTLDNDNLYCVIAHISNLELKPLRAYFNALAHRQGDQWQLEKLAKIISRWFMKQWRVNAEKDGQEKAAQYRQLKQAWAEHANHGDIVRFWLNTDQEWTIPPYQSQTNRHPPDCQSLILNLGYMNRQYRDWRDWLAALDTARAPDLSAVTRRKDGEPLADDNQQNLRQLHFLLDRAQKNDPYKLNLIWSQYHRRQKYHNGSQEYKDSDEALKQHIANSTLPDALKRTLLNDFNALEQEGRQKTFTHFLNQYYQSRRKAWDGRYFLHPENNGYLKPGKLDDQNKLLTLCPHRPRQKHHQMNLDFAAIVGLTPADLERKLNDQTVEKLLGDIKKFSTNADNAAKAQKEHRGELKLKLQQGKDKKLNNLAKRVEDLAIELAARLWPDLDDSDRQEKARRFNSLFSFAQIHNIVFKDRSGFSNTCPVCSTDNAGRMVEDDENNALARRLPALSVRLIDGAVKRLLDYNANEIARRHWELIEPKLHEGHEVRVPLILEQNRFEFEPSLNKLKGKSTNDSKKAPEIESFDEKEDRIKRASGGICPYNGTPLSDSGELDHIIPRASIHGTLNDEANLIYVSQAANRSRSNQTYYLRNLDTEYKRKQFDTTDDAAIRAWIYQTLTGQPSGSDVPFVFGNYLSFINLDADQQRAFRHALFLDDDDPLKKRVIAALKNRNRSFVNGTQRFFAQLIADKLHERARKANPAGKLSFDYFEYPADPRHPKGVQNLRAALGIEKQKIQEDYSHHVDAHMAFLLACDDHRGDGSLGIDFGNITSVWPFDDGDITAYKMTKLEPNKVTSVKLKRNSSNDKINKKIETNHTNRLKDNNFRQLFKQNSIGQTYMPIVCHKDKWYIGYPRAVRGGYDLSHYHATVLKGKEAKTAETIAKDSTFYELTKSDADICIYTCRKEEDQKVIDKEVAKFLGRDSKNKLNKEEESRFKQLIFILEKCRIYMTRKPLSQAPTVIASKNAQKHPSIEAWNKFHEGWKKITADAYSDEKSIYDLHSDDLIKWRKYCEEFLNISQPTETIWRRKKRTVYSMNTVGTSSGTVLQINRRGEGIYQAVPIDNNELAKELVPYLVLNSRHLSWPHKEARKALTGPLEPLKKQDINRPVQAKQFFTEKLLNRIESTSEISVTVENTKVTIANFPLELLSEVLTLDEKKPEGAYILTDKKLSNDARIAKKSVIGQWCIPACRDGDLRILKLFDNGLCNFEIPYRYKDIQKFIEALEQP